MAQMVYYQLVKTTSEMQQEVARQTDVINLFGPDALPVNSMRLSHLHVLSSMREEPNRIRLDLNKKIQDNIAVIEEFEKLFAAAEEADIKDFAEAMAARWKDPNDANAANAG